LKRLIVRHWWVDDLVNLIKSWMCYHLEHMNYLLVRRTDGASFFWKTWNVEHAEQNHLNAFVRSRS
jgi:hypothetical protein